MLEQFYVLFCYEANLLATFSYLEVSMDEYVIASLNQKIAPCSKYDSCVNILIQSWEENLDGTQSLMSSHIYDEILPYSLCL
mgnify:CR=1 FL=1